MNIFYRSIRDMQDAAPPIRSKWVAVITYAALATMFGLFFPALARRIHNMMTYGPTVAILGALYGHCKWSIAVDRFSSPSDRRQVEKKPTQESGCL